MASRTITPPAPTPIPDVASNIGSGMSGIDALISAQMKLVAAQAQAAQRQSLLLTHQANKQARANRRQLAGLNAELAANANPSNVIPPAPSLSNAEVQQAADQVRIDAAKRTGQRASILAGSGTLGPAGSGASLRSGAASGALSPATGLRSLLG